MERILKVGIMLPEERQKQILKSIKTKTPPSPNEPKVFFDSLDSFAKLFNHKNKVLLNFIHENPKASISELANLVGRKQSNLSKILKKLEVIGIIEFKKDGRKRIPFVLYDKVIIEEFILDECA